LGVLGVLHPGLAAHAGDPPSSSIDEVEDAEEDAVCLAYEGPTVDIALAL
jgi:hypothetical protein